MKREVKRSSEYKPRLSIHVVWHPDFQFGREIAERIYAHFSHDPDRPSARGLGIPVVYQSVSPIGANVLPPMSLAEAQHTAVVLLVDTKMVNSADDGWRDYANALWRQALIAPQQHRLFPVALHKSAFLLSTQIGEVNFLRQEHLTSVDLAAPFLNTLTNELSRLLTQRPSASALRGEGSPPCGPPRMRLFISHAKLDGEKTAVALRDYIHQHLALDTFFDATDIAIGFRFEDMINEGIDNAAFVVVQTDAYASRVWCQHEIIRAKRHARPVVVIHAIQEGEARSFPYIGNVPTIRWRADEPSRTEAVVGLVLREVLRVEYFQQHFEDLKKLFGVPDAVRALPRAPELLTCLALRAESATVPYFVYPDPPLAKQEMDLLAELDPNLRLTTPTLLFAKPSEPADFASRGLAKAAAGWRIGISISDSPDLMMRGFGQPHLRAVACEFARFLLAAGATLAYGGDLRQGGFTEVLFELLSAYRAITGDAVDAVQSYLAWPIYLDLDEGQQALLQSTARFHKIPPPDDLGLDAANKILPATPEGRVIWARCLTAMRERMSREIHARLLMGGQVRGLGKYPGLAEEALLAVRARKPVYLIGAFGGCAEAVIGAVLGNEPKILTMAFQSEKEIDRAAIELYNRQRSECVETIDYAELSAEFKSAGVTGLNNGLSEEENERLFTTRHLPEMVALVLRGLNRLGAPQDLGI